MVDNGPETEHAQGVSCPTSTQKPVDQGFSHKKIGSTDCDELGRLIKKDNEWIERHRDPSRPEQASAEELKLLMEEPPVSLLNAYAQFFDDHLPSGHTAVKQFFRDGKMLIRMWKHAMNPVLQSLHRNLPASRDHMQKFIKKARNLAALLCKSVSAYKQITAEICGDLSYCLRETAESDSPEHNAWSLEAGSWYHNALKNSHPSEWSRLFYRVAAVQSRPTFQLYYYARSAADIHPYVSPEKGMMSVFEQWEDSDVDGLFVLTHALLYIHFHQAILNTKGYRFDSINNGSSFSRFTDTKKRWLDALNRKLRNAEYEWVFEGVQTVVILTAAWFNYDNYRNALHRYLRIRSERPKTTAQAEESKEKQEDTLLKNEFLKADQTIYAARITRCMLDVMIHHAENDNVLPPVHVVLAFLFSLSRLPGINELMTVVLREALVEFLNTLIKSGKNHGLNITAVAKQPLFPLAIDNEQPEFQKQVLPEDYVLAGLVWAGEYLPPNWVLRKPDMEGCEENASTWLERIRRILKLGMELADRTHLMDFDEKTERFSEDKSGCTMEESVLVLED